MVILVVDDDPVSLLLAEHILRGGGYDVVTAADATQAEATMRTTEGPIDVVICDYMMPGANGLDFLERLLSDDDLGGAPFILLTGVSEADELCDERVEQATAFLTKPVKSEDLLAVVAQVLAEHPPAI